jgi:hypothetical protein
MAKNLSIVAQGISGDEGKLLGYNVSDNGIYTPAIGDVVRGTNATYVAQDGLIKTAPPNVARVDYTNGVAELLLEPSSTNLVPYSYNFMTWSDGGASLTPYDAISPNGTQNATRIIFSTNQTVQQSTSVPIGVVATASIYIKGNIGETIVLNAGGVDGVHTLIGEWQRIETSGVTSNVNIRISASGGVTARDVLVWGAQMEQRSSATSYISTNGATSTRSTDSMLNFGSSQIIDSQSGILFFEGNFIDNSYGRFSLRNDSDETLINISSSSGQVVCSYLSQGANNGVMAANTDAVSKSVKIAFKYKTNDFSLWVDGVKVGEVLSGQSGGSATSFSFYDNTAYFYGRVRQVKHLPFNTNISTL